jgi:hypothetical protein
MALVVAGLAYVASIGPACWLTSHLNAGGRLIPAVYRPITWGLAFTGSNQAIRWYCRLASARDWDWWRWEYVNGPWRWEQSPWMLRNNAITDP